MTNLNQRDRELLARLNDTRRELARLDAYITPGGGSVSSFVDLDDVPASYSGAGNQVVRVKSSEDGLEFSTAGAVDSVNGQTGAVVLDADDIDDSTTTHKFATAAEKSLIASAVQPEDLAAVATSGSADDIDDTSTTNKFATAAELALIDSAVQPGDLAAIATSGSADDLADGTTNKAYTAAEQTKLAGIEAAADVTDAVNIASAIHGADGKTTPVDADELALIDSAASNVLKKLTWANLKATVKTYFDTLYGGLGTANTWTARQIFGPLAMDSETVTIATGVLTVSKSKVFVNGEGGLADDLVTISSGSTQDGQLLILSRGGAVNITVKHNVGNIRLNGLADFVLDNQRDVLMLMYMSLPNAWVQIGGGNNA